MGHSVLSQYSMKATLVYCNI